MCASARRKSKEGGAIGFGVIKYPPAVNSPAMRRLYDLAAELNLPLLNEGKGTFTSPFSGLHAMRKAHSMTTLRL